MIDSTNPRQLADNIRKLWDKLKSISGDLLPSRSTATTGQILKLTGENNTPAWADEYSYTPPAYSKTEVNTGQKWIDGKDIYCIAYTGTIPEIAITTSITIGSLNYDKIINGFSVIYLTPSIINRHYIRCSGTSVTLQDVIPAFSNYDYLVTVYYTKPDPAPETRDDDTPEEVKETKTRKKTTK